MKYHVYGVGNALVDSEFEVSDAFLTENDIEKGLMTLIDDEKHQAIANKLTETFGLKKRAGGGSLANSMVAIAQLGGNGFYACKVADDENGHFYRDNLAEAGVKTKLDLKNEGVATGQCMVMVTPDAERTMNTYLGITSDFSEQELHAEEIAQAEYIYIEGYLVTSDVSRAAAIKAKQLAQSNGVKVALTFSDPAMAAYFSEGLSEIIGDGVDLLFCNEEECKTYTKQDTLDAALNVLKAKAKKIVVTQGAEGAMIVTGDTVVKVAGNKAEAIDTNGAGDMFAGSFLYGLTQGMSDEKSATLANAAAAKVVTVFGARLDKEAYDFLSKTYC